MPPYCPLEILYFSTDLFCREVQDHAPRTALLPGEVSNFLEPDFTPGELKGSCPVTAVYQELCYRILPTGIQNGKSRGDNAENSMLCIALRTSA